MKIGVIAYFKAGANTLSYSDAEVIIPKPLKIKITVSEEESHAYDIKRIIKTEVRSAGKRKFYLYTIEIEDAGILKQLRLRFYPDELLWNLEE